MLQSLDNLTPKQLAAIEAPLNAKTFIEGPAGSGKTTVGVERLLFLLEAGIPGNKILLLVPQRTLAARYYDALRSPGVPVGGIVTVLTIGGLAKRMVELFWPLVAEKAGFARPNSPPTFLTLETAQYYMARLIRPLLQEGYFEGVTIERNRLYSQILDNLNKAAVVGFAHTQIGARLKGAWAGDPGQSHVYEDAQNCANIFRDYCLENNLLDFSLQLEIFNQYLCPKHKIKSETLCQKYLKRRYHHLIVDNLEEDVPVTFDLLEDWLPTFDSAMLIFDLEAGYRRFMGADPRTTRALKQLCDEHILFSASFVTSDAVAALEIHIAESMQRPSDSEDLPNPLPAIHIPESSPRYYPQMLDWVSNQIETLIDEEEVPAGEIVVLAPYLSDALRFSLTERLEARQIPAYSHRPSRSLRDEPATQTLLTLTALAHPQWGITPSQFDLAYTFIQAITEMDLMRAQLLSGIVYRERSGTLSSFDKIKPDMQARITYKLGGRYEELRQWLSDYAQSPPDELDHFLSRIFGEILSQPGFGFHSGYDNAEVTANLIESVHKFRRATGERLAADETPLGAEYLQMVESGVIAAQYIFSWQNQPEDAVFLSPAYTFLMRNRAVEYQFWLDVGSRGWYERVRQPLTHPYVLSRNWDIDRPWTDNDEYETSQEALYRMTLGLIRRCRSGIFLGLSKMGAQGYEHKGLLLRAVDRVLRRVND
ncbi:MAG: hypothetical protein U9Q82_08785 [Chloroflexota bacterium]|nr:hypothetical protein [Chloroflexota bacterium]